MPFDSLKSVESDKKFTLLNIMTATRAFGGIALGIGMSWYSINPIIVAITAAFLGLLDGESTVLQMTMRFPRLQRIFHIIPSTIGRIADPIADKIYAVSIFAGGLANGSIPQLHGVGILSMELATSAVTIAAKVRGIETQVSLIGKAGMVARFSTIGFDLAAAALHPGQIHSVLHYLGYGSAILAIVLGGLSCFNLMHQYKHSSTS